MQAPQKLLPAETAPQFLPYTNIELYLSSSQAVCGEYNGFQDLKYCAFPIVDTLSGCSDRKLFLF